MFIYSHQQIDNSSKIVNSKRIFYEYWALGIQLIYHSSLAMSLSWLSLGTEEPLKWAAFSHLENHEQCKAEKNLPKKQRSISMVTTCTKGDCVGHR